MIEVIGDRDHRLDVDALANAEQEGQAEPECDEVGKQSAGDEQAGGGENKRRRATAARVYTTRARQKTTPGTAARAMRETSRSTSAASPR